jgi:hypothetical protein
LEVDFLGKHGHVVDLDRFEELDKEEEEGLCQLVA